MFGEAYLVTMELSLVWCNYDICGYKESCIFLKKKIYIFTRFPDFPTSLRVTSAKQELLILDYITKQYIYFNKFSILLTPKIKIK